MDPADVVRDLVLPLLEGTDLELYDVEIVPGMLRILLDRPEGVDLEAISRATSAISDAIDEADPLPDGHYTLEVSSPGLERPLRRREHFQRSLGSVVAVKTRSGVEGDRRIQGVLAAAGDDEIVVETPEGAIRRLRYQDVDRARSVFEWGPSPKPTGAAPRTKKPAKAQRRATAS
jgi:ribosome maturation factor RimP